MEILFERIFLNKIEYYVNNSLEFEFNLESKNIRPVKPREDAETQNRGLSEKQIAQLRGLTHSNSSTLFLYNYLTVDTSFDDFSIILQRLIANRATNDAFEKIKGGEVRLVMRELKILRQIEELSDQTIELLSSHEYAEMKWEGFSDELARLVHEEMKRKGYVYETQEKVIEKNDLAFNFISKMKDIDAAGLKRHMKNELTFFYFRVTIIFTY